MLMLESIQLFVVKKVVIVLFWFVLQSQALTWKVMTKTFFNTKVAAFIHVKRMEISSKQTIT